MRTPGHDAVTLRLTVCKGPKIEVSATFALLIRIPRFQLANINFNGFPVHLLALGGVVGTSSWQRICLGIDEKWANRNQSGDNLVMMMLMINLVCRKALLGPMKPFEPLLAPLQVVVHAVAMVVLSVWSLR